MPMTGFSDREPDNWDMAVGTVRGYRWWNMTVPMARISGYDPLTYNLRPYAIPAETAWSERLNPCAEPYFPYTERFVPNEARTVIEGMHGGQWKRKLGQADGRYKAQCVLGDMKPVSHEIMAPECGCGFWAYWNGLPMEWDTCIPYVRKADWHTRLAIPLAGVIEGSGKTVIGERGFRSEYARITDLTFNVNTDCLVYDEMRTEQEAYYTSQMVMGAPVTVYCPQTNPRNAGNFATFVERDLGIRADVLMDSVKGIAENILGDDINWHEDIAALHAKCPPDANYGVPRE